MSVQLKLKPATFRHVESELAGYNDTRKEILRLKNEILHGSGRGEDENTGGGRGGMPGDPTARTAMLLTSHKKLEQLQAIVDAIESIVERLPADRRKLIKLKYWTRPQVLTWDGIAQELHVSRITAIRWRDDIVNAVAEKVGWR